MRIQLNGPFRIFDDQGRDVTPKGIKERGLLALLLLSPGQRRTRAWLQDKLWSERSPEQASGSSRQALSNMRKSLGSLGEHIHSDRSAVWIEPIISLDDGFDPAMGEMLDDIDIDDPEFSDWLRTLRMQQDAQPVAPAFVAPRPPLRAHRSIALICRTDRSGTTRGAFILRSLSQRIAVGVGLLGDLDVIEIDAEDRFVADDQPLVRVDLECLDDSEAAFVLMRVTAEPNNRIIWSGRLSVFASIAELWDSEDVARAINRAVQAVADTVSKSPNLAAMAAINRAIRRIYEFDRSGLAKADELLRGALDSDLRGPALAWRGFVRLTEQLEFRETDTKKRAEAMDFAEEAQKIAPDHPVVLSLVSQIMLRLTDDPSGAHYFAARAIAQDETNPYALDALCQTLILQRRFAEANLVADKALKNASGLPHSFSWDLLASFTALSVENMEGALDLALACHRKMPFYRPALRYMTAISCLMKQPENAMHYAGQLRRLEPDFKLQNLLNDAYPVGTLRDLGLIADLRPLIS